MFNLVRREKRINITSSHFYLFINDLISVNWTQTKVSPKNRDLDKFQQPTLAITIPLQLGKGE